MSDPQINIIPKKIVFILGVFVCLFAFAHISSYVFTELTYEKLFLSRKLDLDREQTVPAYFSSVLLLFSSVLLWIIAVNKKKQNNSYSSYWAWLSAIFLYLSVDETVAIHEQFSVLFDCKTGLFKCSTGIFHWGWTLVYIPLLLIFLVVFLRFIFHLPPKIKILFIAAGIIYCAGAIIGDAAGGWYAEKIGEHYYKFLPYVILVTIEETLEMTGIVVFIYGLLDYLRTNLPEIQFRIAGTKKTA